MQISPWVAQKFALATGTISSLKTKSGTVRLQDDFGVICGAILLTTKANHCTGHVGIVVSRILLIAIPARIVLVPNQRKHQPKIESPYLMSHIQGPACLSFAKLVIGKSVVFYMAIASSLY